MKCLLLLMFVSMSLLAKSGYRGDRYYYTDKMYDDVYENKAGEKVEVDCYDYGSVIGVECTEK